MDNIKLLQVIVNKLDNIFENAGFIDSAVINIEVNRREIPIITYKIKEFITPDIKEDQEPRG